MPKNIYLVEDEAIDIKIVENLIFQREVGISLESFNSCQEAWDHLKIQPLARFPDLILLDLYLPFMNGFEFLEQYHQHFFPKVEKTSIIILTSSFQQRDMETSFSFPAVADYLVKPFNKSHLARVLQIVG